MKEIPKTNIFKTPEGYFESLPDRILDGQKKKRKTINPFWQIAAAAVLVFGILVFVLRQDKTIDQSIHPPLEEEVDLYISSGYWEVEDILLFSENPDVILDQILKEEWGTNENQLNDAEEWL